MYASGEAYTIDQSLRFNYGDGYLRRTFPSAGDQETWTYSGWVKKAKIDSSLYLFATDYSDANNLFYINVRASHATEGKNYTGELVWRFGSTTTRSLRTEQKFRDCGAWMHICAVCDTGNATNTNRLRLYVNGEEITSFSTDERSTISQNDDLALNRAGVHEIGAWNGAGQTDGYLAEMYFIDGQALTPASFGETSSTTNQWIPLDSDDVKDAVTFGTNGFYQKYAGTELADSFTDSATGNVIFRTGDGVMTKTGQKKFGTASGFWDATADSYLTAGGTNIGATGTGDWTIEAWIYNDVTQTDTNRSFLTYTAASNNNGLQIEWQATGVLSCWDYSLNNDWTLLCGTSSATAIDTWFHLAVVRSGNTFTMYIDGVATANTRTQSGDMAPSAGPQIGYHRSASTRYLRDTYVDEFRISNVARYTANFTPAASAFVTDANTQLLLHFDGANDGTVFTDSSDTTDPRHTITANGDVMNVRGTNLDTTYTTINAFTSTGADTWTCPAGVTSIELLVVAGGGGGSAPYYAGGGGAGGVIHDTDYTVVPGVVYDLSVGAGGTAGNATAGDDSVWNVNAEGSGITFTADGGGRGGGGGGSNNGGSGGSGGGDDNEGTGGGGSSTQTSPSGATGYGNAGGGSASGTGGGGGGANAAGAVGVSNTTGGAGGAGKLFSTFVAYGTDSSNVASTGSNGGYFGGGGGGASYNNTQAGGVAGVGGGGKGGGTDSSSNQGTIGIANTGGGGGGGDTNGGGKAGGSGIVLIAYSGTKPGSSSIYFLGDEDFLEAESMAVNYGNDFTAECWFYCTDASTSQGWPYVIEPRTPSVNCGLYSYIRDDNLLLNDVPTAINENQWYHFAMVGDGATLRGYLDGVEFCDITNPGTGTPDAIVFGSRNASGGAPEVDSYFKGYMDEIRVSDSCRYPDGTTFTPSTTEFTADSNTMLLIHSDWDGGIGADSSGNYNTFTPTNLVATDQVLDSPTNNFATFFPTGVDLDTDKAISEGNLKVTFNSGSSGTAHSTLAINDGNKWYAEFLVLGTPASGEPVIGIDNNIGWSSGIGYNGSTTNDSIGYVSTDGKIYKGGSLVDTESTFTTNDIIQVAFDGSTGRIYFGKNNTWQNSGDPAGGTGYVTTAALEASYIGFACGGHSTGSQAVVANFGQDSSFAGAETAQGNQDSNSIGDFYYEPPTGFLALCTSNLAAPEIALPGDHFNTVLYTGNGGGSTDAITGVGFQTDLNWIKKRSASADHYLTNSVSGLSKGLMSSLPAATDDIQRISSFDSDGFTLPDTLYSYVNTSGATYVSWNWKAGGIAVSNTDGTITSSVSANPTAGFSIVKWTGTGSDATVGHGLSQAPDLIINKSMGSAHMWAVQSIRWASPSDTNMLYLNSDAAEADDTNVFQAAPTASVFSPQGGAWAGIGANTIEYIAYCFHSVEGYSKVGTYRGNAQWNGPFIYTGFRPAYLWVKGDGNSQHWHQFDNKQYPYNPTSNTTTTGIVLEEAANTGGGGGEGMGAIDILSNGFKLRANNGNGNDSNTTFIYYAVAESPFKYSNAR
jgi:hypothetical protein